MLRCKGIQIHEMYQVTVTIIEARHLLQNSNPMVIVKVGNQKRKTIVRKSTDSPYYNEYFVFDFTGDFNTFLNTKISILVYLKNHLRLKFHGGISFEVATVWEQPDHEYYHKWAILTNPKDRAGGTRGYIKCNISLNAKGEKLRIHSAADGEDDIEGNLLMPIANYQMFGRQRARFMFNVYRADGLPYTDSIFCCGNSRSINPYVQISFAGMEGETSWHNCEYHTHFNERIIFTEMYPPLCFRIVISIKDKINGCHSSTIATQTLNLLNLLKCVGYEYLPTFGPSFIHFYQTHNFGHEYSCVFKCHSSKPIYRGRVLLSLKVEIDNSQSSIARRVDIEPTTPIVEKSLWAIEEYLLVGIIYDVCMIDRCKFMMKSISFEMNFGNIGSKEFPDHIENKIIEMNKTISNCHPDFRSRTEPQSTTTLDGKFNHLQLASNKPCMYIKSWWPNFEWRISNSNFLSYIAKFLENSLTKLETLIATKSEMAYSNYNNIMNTLKYYCMHYLDMLNSRRYDIYGGTTKLDRHRIVQCRECIEDIARMIKLNGNLSNNNHIKIAIIHAHNFLLKIQRICEDPQHAFPDVFIWMIAGTKRVAVARLAASEIMYEEQELSRGSKCGKRINLFLKNIDYNADGFDNDACNIEIFLWLGNMKFSSACWSFIPGGYQLKNWTNDKSFPQTFNYVHSWKFQLQAHIFQGRFDSGVHTMDSLNSFVRILFRGYTAMSTVIKQSFAPVWDESFVLHPINLYGTRENINSLPPPVMIEVFDWNSKGINKFYGRCIAYPTVKFINESYLATESSPILTWHTLITPKNVEGSILAAFELIEIRDDINDNPAANLNNKMIHRLPDNIRPIMMSHRLEIVFWGVRDMKKMNGIRINKPRIIVECSGIHINSEIIKNAEQFANFHENHVIINLDLPQQYIYYPPITIKMYDSRNFGRFVYIGICIIPSCHIFLNELITEEQYNNEIYGKSTIIHQRKDPIVIHIVPLPEKYMSPEEKQRMINLKKFNKVNFYYCMGKILGYLKILFFGVRNSQKYERILCESDDDIIDSWWSKYFASLEREKYHKLKVDEAFLVNPKGVPTFKVYESELEMQPEFRKFHDKLTTFELSRQKVKDYLIYDGNTSCGKFKGHIVIYQWPPPTGSSCKTRYGNNVANGLLVNYPPNGMVKLLVRLYIIKGINLHPCDPFSDKSDSYLIIKLGENCINDRKNYIANQSNPIFGKSFEMTALLPRDHTLIVQVWDRDSTSTDDMIGETKIDIENRYYSDHRGGCGISNTYTTSGYNSWRDSERPMQILQSLCKNNNLPAPEFSINCVKIGNHKFPYSVESKEMNESECKECMALNVLHQWQLYPICGVPLVPEHIERRSLFNMKKSGLEQGKLELWVDIFHVNELPPKPLVDIKPQVPQEFELRVIIWNIEDVPLVDNQFLNSEKCSDIYVKCWIKHDDCQKTDVHYNSLTGEGNFNWRFVFRFAYSISEHLMIIRTKLSTFSVDETDQKLPCKLYLQVWDNDHFSSNDFLGSLTIDLARMPRGSTNSRNCTLKVTDPSSPTINLFRVKHLKAWWPFCRVANNGEYFLAGKVEMELALMPLSEAEMAPVGKGRDPPNPLPLPIRPDTSFSWFRNPWKACRFVICRYYRCRIICFCSAFLLVLLLCCAIYAFPGYLVKKLLGA